MKEVLIQASHQDGKRAQLLKQTSGIVSPMLTLRTLVSLYCTKFRLGTLHMAYLLISDQGSFAIVK